MLEQGEKTMNQINYDEPNTILEKLQDECLKYLVFSDNPEIIANPTTYKERYQYYNLMVENIKISFLENYNVYNLEDLKFHTLDDLNFDAIKRLIVNYPRTLELDYFQSKVKIELTKDGRIISISKAFAFPEIKLGTRLEELLNNPNLNIYLRNQIRDYLADFNRLQEIKANLLDATLYRLIYDKTSMKDITRALDFASIFERNIDIPLIFGLDTKDPSCSMLIDQYLEMGGSLNTICFNGYSILNEKRPLISVDEALHELLNKSLILMHKLSK